MAPTTTWSLGPVRGSLPPPSPRPTPVVDAISTVMAWAILAALSIAGLCLLVHIFAGVGLTAFLIGYLIYSRQ